MGPRWRSTRRGGWRATPRSSASRRRDNGEPLDVGRRTRAIPPALARALRSRDGGCRFPGCTRTRFTEGHHVKHWADGGETRLGNLVTLCRFHHRLVHEGGFGLRVTDDGVFVFTRPDGARVAENGERCFRGSVVAAREPDASFEETLRIHVLNLEAGFAIDAKTSRCRWLGESMDYSQAIEGMQFLRDRAAALRAGASPQRDSRASGQTPARTRTPVSEERITS